VWRHRVALPEVLPKARNNQVPGRAPNAPTIPQRTTSQADCRRRNLVEWKRRSGMYPAATRSQFSLGSSSSFSFYSVHKRCDFFVFFWNSCNGDNINCYQKGIRNFSA
jgi:hypothetical protein